MKNAHALSKSLGLRKASARRKQKGWRSEMPQHSSYTRRFRGRHRRQKDEVSILLKTDIPWAVDPAASRTVMDCKNWRQLRTSQGGG